MRFYSHLITTKVLHSYLTFAKRVFKKKSGFYLQFEKRAGKGIKRAIFSKQLFLQLAKNKLYGTKL